MNLTLYFFILNLVNIIVIMHIKILLNTSAFRPLLGTVHVHLTYLPIPLHWPMFTHMFVFCVICHYILVYCPLLVLITTLKF
jgi:hypothetical protein